MVKVYLASYIRSQGIYLELFWNLTWIRVSVVRYLLLFKIKDIDPKYGSDYSRNLYLKLNQVFAIYFEISFYSFISNFLYLSFNFRELSFESSMIRHFGLVSTFTIHLNVISESNHPFRIFSVS